MSRVVVQIIREKELTLLVPSGLAEFLREHLHDCNDPTPDSLSWCLACSYTVVCRRKL